MIEELKPCPFCGSPAKIFSNEGWSVVCQNSECECNARIPYCASYSKAMEEWNIRFIPSTHAADIETVRKALDCYRISSLREGNRFALEYANNALAALDRLEER